MFCPTRLEDLLRKYLRCRSGCRDEKGRVGKQEAGGEEGKQEEMKAMVPEQQPDEGGQRVGVTEEETNQRDNEFRIWMKEQTSPMLSCEM